MSVNLSPLGGAGWQFLDNSGNVLSGGLLYTYSAGTTTPLTTYQDATGTTANANPVVLDAAGRVSGEVWLTAGLNYKFVLKTSTGTTLWTADNISGGTDAAASVLAQLAASGGSNLIGFLQSGTGAVATTVQSKLRETVSVLDFGADPVGGSDSSTAIEQAATESTQVSISPGTYLSQSAVVETPSMLVGNATLKQDTADASMLIVADTADINNRVEDAKVVGVNFGPMPNATADNWAALHFNTTKGGIVALANFKDVWTGVRNGYYLGGAASQDNLVLGCYFENAKQFAVENIQSNYNRIIGIAVHNNGNNTSPATSGHGIRFSGSNQGSMLVASNIRDRNTTAVSFQQDAYNAVVSAVYVENTADDGIRATATSTIDGRHVIAPVMIKNAGADGIDLSYLSGCLVSASVDTAASAGIRTSTTAAEGKHRIDGITRATTSSGLSLRSDKNLVTIIVDSASATPVSISGSNNLVVVLAADNTISNTVFITGSNNVVLMNEAGTGTVGLRIDGSQNYVVGRVTGNLSVVGDSNVMDLFVQGNTTIQAGADNNKLSGICNGTFADNGSGNDCSGILGGNTRGSTTGTTDSNGLLAITHGCKKAPVSANLTIRMNAAYFCTVTAISSSTITAKVWDAAGAAVASTSVTIDWQAVI